MGPAYSGAVPLPTRSEVVTALLAVFVAAIAGAGFTVNTTWGLLGLAAGVLVVVLLLAMDESDDDEDEVLE